MKTSENYYCIKTSTEINCEGLYPIKIRKKQENNMGNFFFHFRFFTYNFDNPHFRLLLLTLNFIVKA